MFSKWVYKFFRILGLIFIIVSLSTIIFMPSINNISYMRYFPKSIEKYYEITNEINKINKLPTWLISYDTISEIDFNKYKDVIDLENFATELIDGTANTINILSDKNKMYEEISNLKNIIDNLKISNN